MKRVLLFSAILLFSIRGIAQHPLIGTWKLISVKGINADGKPFSLDTTQIRETKIYTATHYMLIAEDVRGDSTVFNRCYAGNVKFDGIKLFETPFQASIPIFDGVKTDFNWNVKGDIFTQSGTITRPDGKQIKLEELKFMRVKESNPSSSTTALGAWSLLSSKSTDMTKKPFDPSSGAVFVLVTPTHWMRISKQNGKFNEAVGGTYEVVNGKTILHITEGSASYKGEVEVTDKVEDGKLLLTRKITGKQNAVTFDEVYVRAQPVN